MKNKQELRPARFIGARAPQAVTKKVAYPDKWKKCDDCRAPISKTEYHYNNGVCSSCAQNN